MWIEVNFTENEIEDLDIFYSTLNKAQLDRDYAKALKKIVEAYRHHTKPQRNASILKMRDEGYTFNAIACEYHISTERVRQICIKEERRRKFRAKLDNSLADDQHAFFACLLKAVPVVDVNDSCAIRAYNCLCRAGIINEMQENRTTLDEYADSYLMNIRNFGVTSLMLSRKANDFYKEMLNSKQTDI